jgi:C-terminal processing protease CtpA/Prc
MRYHFAAAAIVLTLSVLSCKKGDNSEPEPGPGPGGTAATREELLLDSVYLYSKEVYLWQEKIPAYDAFNPRQYKGSSELQSGQKVMDAIRKLQPLDRFSFVTTEEESSGLQTGEDKDFGFFIKAATVDRIEPVDSVYWFVNYVYSQSSAGQAGVQRGWYISKINNTSLGYTQASANLLNEVFFGTGTSASFEFTKPDNSKVTATLNKTSFTSNSVLHRSVIDAGPKKAGYLVFNQFFGAPSRNELAEAFTFFQAQGINELVVDLRYNSGGSVETQDTLANLIAPLAANNQTMYQYVFNTVLQNNQHQLIRKRLGYGNMFAAANNTVKYKKAGTLNLPRVFFIVSASSASASELLINNLKPYMEVKLIGDTTYGKPVGFFPIPVYDYAIYPISFKTVNSSGNADYYTGFVPDRLSPDGVNKNWGDVTEPSLAYALKYITTGSFARMAQSDRSAIEMQAMRKVEVVGKELNERKNKFKGMFIEPK